MKIDNSPPRGTRDLLPAAVTRRDHVLGTIAEVYRRYGYQRIETPGLEDIVRLQSSQGGENEKLIYRVLRRGLGETIDGPVPVSELVDLGLRFDLTVPLTRFYGNNHAHLPLPFRSFQSGPVWRAERPQRGRYRQFTQCDIDLVGEASPLAEAELIEATSEALSAVGLMGAVVRLSDRRLLAALAEAAGLPPAMRAAFFIGLDKLDKIGWEGVRSELGARGLPAGPVDLALERIRALRELPPAGLADGVAGAVPGLDDTVVADLALTARCLDRLGGLTWEFDPTLVRGMGYYTGQVFEIRHPSSSSSIAGGGRYDDLIGASLGRRVPACGFSIGFERILDLVGDPPPTEAVAVLYDREVAPLEALERARELRNLGRRVSLLPRQGSLGKQLSRLEEWRFTSFLDLGGDQPVEERPLQGGGASGGKGL